MNNYRDLLNVHAGAERLKEIRESINKGLVLGSERFTLPISIDPSACHGKKIGKTKTEKYW
ncbi:hypothetical protein NOC27_2735 [Nitrosococcus oceani AFC27]|nr:hypothetical protein NOC27_2735 [Nitrosococcus oceani AFC27]